MLMNIIYRKFGSYFSVVLYYFLILCNQQVFAENPVNPIGCIGPIDSVQVTMKEVNTNTYEYTVKNDSQKRIVDFWIGDGDLLQMEATQFNIPSNIDSPTNWEGSYRLGLENPYMRIVWKSNDISSRIANGVSLSGFRIQLIHPWVPRNKYPFSVLFEDASCSWGNVTLSP